MNQQYQELCMWGSSEFQRMYLVEDENHRTWMKKVLPLTALPLYQVLLEVDDIHLIQIHEVWQEAGECIVIEEFVNGYTLSDYMQLRECTCLSPQVALAYTAEVCDGLNELHVHGIVHRDIKPENLMITNDGILKICDYNIARIYQNQRGNDTRILGTQGFAAPEQFGYRQTDARSDIYATGILLNVFLTGKLPSECLYQGRTDIQQIIIRATAVEPKERYANVKEMKREIRKVLKKFRK